LFAHVRLVADTDFQQEGGHPFAEQSRHVSNSHGITYESAGKALGHRKTLDTPENSKRRPGIQSLRLQNTQGEIAERSIMNELAGIRVFSSFMTWPLREKNISCAGVSKT
jgi:hypothetical protein